jgi:hypothetical protein
MTIVIKGYVVLIDDEDYDKIKGYPWWAITNAKHNHPEQVYFSYDAGTQGRPLLHRYVLGLKPRDGKIVDHINGNTLDCRKRNLRIVTISQNNWNSHRNLNSSTGYKGVDYHKAERKYRARICFNGKRISLGSYKTAKEAHTAYCEASKKYHGEYGRTD